jgi:hypothetical protein
MTIKEQCKNDEAGINIKISKYFEKSLADMLKVLAKRRKNKLCSK